MSNPIITIEEMRRLRRKTAKAAEKLQFWVEAWNERDREATRLANRVKELEADRLKLIQDVFHLRQIASRLTKRIEDLTPKDEQC